MRFQRTFVLVLLVIVGIASVSTGDLWMARPIVVHEWGVNEYDWAVGVAVPSDMPKFIYTDAKPGKPVPPAAPRVKDLPPDSGARRKPILYFYPEWMRGDSIPVAAEVRFVHGDAAAWWPQVSVYRTPDEVAAAKPVDWEAWRKGREKERWARPLPRTPDDERFDLCWERLELSKEPPKGIDLLGGDLPADHWVKRAREVDACYVSNGKEAERYLFYEGTTRRTPQITILAPTRGERDYHIVNVGDHPIYDVFAVYRDTAHGRLWVGHLPVMPPVSRRTPEASGWGHEVPQIISLPLANLEKMRPGDSIVGDEFNARTTERLIDGLTAGAHYTNGCFDRMRDPADPQPPSRAHQLYRKEAVALEAIWHDDFFEADALTIIYRESPAALDEAMPLRIYTDMYHYVKLSRCGLVLNRNVNYAAAKAVADAVRDHVSANDAKVKARALDTCRANRFLALGQIEFQRRYTGRKDFGAALRAALSE